MTCCIAYPLPHLRVTVVGADTQGSDGSRRYRDISKIHQPDGWANTPARVLAAGHLGQVQRLVADSSGKPLAELVADEAPETEWLVIYEWGEVESLDGGGASTECTKNEPSTLGSGGELARGYLFGLGRPDDEDQAKAFVLAALEFVAEHYVDVGGPFEIEVLPWT